LEDEFLIGESRAFAQNSVLINWKY